MKTVILKIDGMSCSACSNGLEKYLNKQPEIEKAAVNLVLEEASITYSNKLSIKDIEKYIEEAGFKSLGESKKIESKNTINKTPLILLSIITLVIFYITLSHIFMLPIISYLNPNTNPKLYAIILLLLTIPFIIYALDIIDNGIKALLHKMPNMNTLVTIGIFSSWIYSIYITIMIFLGHSNYVHNLYFESSIYVIFFIKLGRYITEKSKDKTRSAIKKLVQLTPKITHLKDEKGYKDIQIDEVKENDILICLPGERIAVDGEITKGTSNFDESFITGESIPVLKEVKSKVIAGSINYESQVEYKAEKIGKDSTISEIVRLVSQASNTKPKIAHMADKICLYFVPTVIIIAMITLILNLIIGNPVSTAITRFVTILVVACPCSLGLATPLAIIVSIGTSATRGILVKDGESLEIAKNVDTVVFDKTGTLTKGILGITKINNHSSLSDKELIEILASIEQYSNHPLAKGIKQYAKENKIKTTHEFATEDLPGYGVKARDENNVYYACNKSLLKKLDITNSYEIEEKEMAKQGNSIIYLVKNNKVIATIGLEDTLRKEAQKLISNLKKRNINVLMLSGDNELTAQKVAKQLNLSEKETIAGITPQEKVKYIKQLQKDKHIVMMVGDGINDAPSLTAASVGVSFNSGTDIAISSASIILANSNLMLIEEIIKTSKNTIKNIKENLFWAFIYNIIMIPIAAGIIPKIKINPMIACIFMIISSLTVTINALKLKRKNRQKRKTVL